ncbi:MAG: ClbS/DfsB family four-helix bundle protein [Clostridia bacterium]
MPRPKTKQELLIAAKEQYTKLQNLIQTMSEEEQEKMFTYEVDTEKEAHWKRDKNLRDVLIHLYEWHQLLLNWVENNTKGITTPFLPEPYNWKTYGEMNIEFWEKHQSTTYQEAQNLLATSHEKVVQVIEKFSNEALFEKGQLKWTGGTTLGSYCVSVTASHYEWAMKKIKKHIKTL